MLHREGPQDGVLQLRLARPQRLNALTLDLARELLAAVERAQADDAVRVLLLAGEGRAFCAGKDRDDPPDDTFVDTLQRLAAALMHGKPVVAAVQGWAVGAGLEILLNCDVVVAARSARFQAPEVHLGLFGTGGVLALLPRAVGLARAKGVLMLGEPFDAAQAEQWGLVWSVVDDDRLAQHAHAVAGQLARSAPRVLAAIKSTLHGETVGDLDAMLAREAQVHGRLR